MDRCIAYLEIYKQLYIAQKNTQDNTYMDKYHSLFHQEYEKLSDEDKEIVKEVINQKILTARREREEIMTILTIVQLKDQKLKTIFPGHIMAQYKDKLKTYQREMHFLQSIARFVNQSKGISK